METLVYKGKVYRGSDEGYGLYLSTIDYPLAKKLEEDIAGKLVTVRYWISDKERSREELVESFILTVMGLAECEHEDVYNEITGYLWTDEEIKIGGHDLLAELYSFVERYLYMEIDVHG